MTPQEHRLMFLMFARQQQHIKVLLNMLRNHHLVDLDDPQAFHSAEVADELSRADIASGLGKEYLTLAARCGIDPQELLSWLYPPTHPSDPA